MGIVKLFAQGMQAVLVAHLSAMDVPPALSAHTIRHIQKRVLPRLVEDFSLPERAIGLLSMDIEDLGLRIYRYRYIERYQEAISFDDPEMGAAFASHIHNLRGSEIYVIQERGADVLSFLHGLTSDFGVSAGDQKAAFKKAFKKQFSRHLRERHRIVHAHERLSLASRMISLSPLDGADPKVADVFIDVVAQLLPRISERIGLTDMMSPVEIRQKLKAFQLNAMDEEAASMWKCFMTAVERTVDPTLLRGLS